MKTFLIIALLFVSATFPQNSGEATGTWCVADAQMPDHVLQAALDWACQHGRADCSSIQDNQPCFLPNTLKDHASVAFNSYYKNYRHVGGDCYFNGAAVITHTDPSHDSCYL